VQIGQGLHFGDLVFELVNACQQPIEALLGGERRESLAPRRRAMPVALLASADAESGSLENKSGCAFMA
jgi:hypothetical protein